MNVLAKRLLFAGLLSIVLARTASATTAAMKLVSGASTLIIMDNGSNDLNPAPGTITFSSLVLFPLGFNGWTISVSSGTSNSPAISPFGMDLTSLSATTAGPNILNVFFSDTGFTVPVGGGFFTDFSATMTGNGSASETAWVDNSNAIFGTAGLIGTVGPLNAPGGFGRATGGPAAGVLYSLTLEQVLTATGPASFSVDGNITPTPELSSLILFGTGLLGLAAVFFQRNSRGLSTRLP